MMVIDMSQKDILGEPTDAVEGATKQRGIWVHRERRRLCKSEWLGEINFPLFQDHRTRKDLVLFSKFFRLDEGSER